MTIILIIAGIILFFILVIVSVVLIKSYLSESTQYLIGFLASLSIVAGLLFFLIKYTDKFINGTYTWICLFVFGYLSYKLLSEYLNEVSEEKSRNYNRKIESKIEALISENLIEDAKKSIDEFTDSYYKNKSVKTLAMYYFKNQKSDLAFETIGLFTDYADKCELLFDVYFDLKKEDSDKPEKNEAHNEIVNVAIESALKIDIIRDFYLKKYAEKLIKINEFQFAKKLIDEISDTIDKERLANLLVM